MMTGDVACADMSGLMEIRNIGKAAVAETKRVLAVYGFEMEEK